ncbi:MAG: hypothetical protein M3024_14380 [Candidatus Dormibacteraeota bacterium]|nr:hypothetical protein [Candidatus Dormibacteraeota bacterium]
MDLSSLPPQFRPVMDRISRALRSREPAIRERVEALRDANPGRPPEALAKSLISETRRRVATTGGLSGAAAVVPGLGTALSIGAVTGQALYALEQETEMVMAIAMVYGHELETSDDRIVEALVVVGIAGGAVKLRDSVLVAGSEAITVAGFRRLPGTLLNPTSAHLLVRVLARLGVARAASSIARLAPFAVGVVAGATFDFVTATALGRAAMRYYGPGGPGARRPVSLPATLIDVPPVGHAEPGS